MDIKQKILDEAVVFFETFLEEGRILRLRNALDFRTMHLTVVMEDVYQAHNASAVMRTCDALGIQQVHFVEEKNVMKINEEVALGSEKWLDILRWPSEKGGKEACYHFLKENHFRIVATSSHHPSFTPHTIPLDMPLALVFGTEKEGLSEFWLNKADMLLKIPMYGFTESFNLSVSAAIILYTLVQRPDFIPFRNVSDPVKKEIYLRWLIQSVRNGDVILKNFLRSKGWESWINDFTNIAYL